MNDIVIAIVEAILDPMVPLAKAEQMLAAAINTPSK